MAIDELIRTVAPPLKPIANGPTDGLRETTQQLGLELPDDLVQLCAQYGSGRFWDKGRLPIEIFNPFDSAKYLQEIKLLCGFIDDAPHSVYPEVSGLLPLGVDDQRVTLYWLTDGPPDSWPIVANTSSDDYPQWNIPLGDFLTGIFTRRITIWKGKFFDDPRKLVFVPQGDPDALNRD